MTYEKYCKSRDMAWDILIDHKITTLPVRIAPLMEEMGITLQSFAAAAPVLAELGLSEQVKGCDGYAAHIGSTTLVYYDDTRPTRRVRYTLAHELGHLCLGHIPRTDNGRLPIILPEQEQQANSFAARLLAPACVLWGLGLHTAYDISSECGISMAAAKVREQRMATLYQREAMWLRTKGHSCFCCTPKERQLYEQFAVYIQRWAKRAS